jgi:hypothetical protein
MIRNILFLLALILLLSGCSNSQEKGIKESSVANHNKSLIGWKQIEIVQANGEKGYFHLGMTLNELNSLDLYNTDFEITETDELDDGQTAIWTPILMLMFDKEGVLYRITVNGNLPTPVGLKNGDSKEILDNLLGKSDATYDSTIEEYYLRDSYFYADVRDGTIVLWGVSNYKYNY